MKIPGSSIDYSFSVRLPDALKSQQQKEARRERAQNLAPDQLPPKLYLGGMVKVKRTMLQRDLETAARTADARRSAHASPQAAPNAAPRPLINDFQLGQVRNVLDNWAQTSQSKDANISQKVAQATDILQIIRRATVHQRTNGRLHLFLRQVEAIPADVRELLNKSGIVLHDSISPVPSTRSARSGRALEDPADGVSGAVSRLPISDVQLGRVRGALDNWIYMDGTDDARIPGRVIQATAFLKDAAQSPVHQDSEGHLHLFLPQRSSLSTGAHTALKNAGIFLQGAASPVPSVRPEQSAETAHPLPSPPPVEPGGTGETVRPLPSLPSVEPDNLTLPSPSANTARSSMQAGPDSTPPVPINDAQLNQVRSVLSAWVDAESSGGGTTSQRIALTTSLLWNVGNSTVHQGTDGRLHLFLPRMVSLPSDLVVALATAGIDLREARSTVSSTRPTEGGNVVASGGLTSGAVAIQAQQASALHAPGPNEELAHWRQSLREWVGNLSSHDGQVRRHNVATNILRWIRDGDLTQALDLRGLKGDELPPGFLQAFTGRLTNVQASLGDINNGVMTVLSERGVEVNYHDSTIR